MSTREGTRSTFPRNAWYALATSEDVGRMPVARRLIDQPILLTRKTSGAAVALRDRCVNLPFPLSRGTVTGDTIVDGYSGFTYSLDGAVIAVPTQAEVPYDAKVQSFPVHESGGLIYVWIGDPAVARLRPKPSTPWLDDAAWSTLGEEWTTQAGATLLQDNFSDITHVATVAPEISPPALLGSTPTLEVEVSETRVKFWRDFPGQPMPAFQAELLDIDRDEVFDQREEGEFVAPGQWVDRWTVRRAGEEDLQLIFSHSITPINGSSTWHAWRVSRNFAPGAAADGVLKPLFFDYYAKVKGLLEEMQDVLDADGPQREVRVQADAAMLSVRRIMRRLAAEEGA
ncbi:aromatic ring-hydroxylating dioxygenase subunit alpha [Ornithinimicrobium sp. INDO-MA30-4]|uniref:aromatic ring-hydroxylating dioxygenase subunit alpha n=1 Tax=Ornithinimicrobium sp. INDO-MA30-4 TaxID=2908651 RepID=UPI001F236280|nr:aromatic ring-hydroxylating dioxygenase subunit alpha [Ornithinimicrobium sp. INDO-MA30-4]UJH70835.1 aromatic ring-hydroxylating dioxygenase subunit alpha [Ornithinimicrobium sp. INDO-MA30-4]